MKVSLDYDGVLTRQEGRDLAKQYMDKGYEVYIVTRRQDRFSDPVYELADELGIERDHVYFTNGRMKWETIKEEEIGMHIDNNTDEVELINDNTSAKGFTLSQVLRSRPPARR